MGQSRKRKTLLSSQKPKKRWPIAIPSYKKILAGSLGLALLGFAAYRSYRYLGETSLFSYEERPHLQAVRGLSEAEQATILQKYRDLRDVSPEDMEKFSRGLYRTLGLRSIQLIQTAPDRIAIATESFTPKIVAELDKLRFVTEDGIVFGSVAEGETVTLPRLQGLYKNAAFTRSENETVVLSAGNQRIVDEALLAIRKGTRYNIQYRSLKFDEFRGLTGDMLEADYHVTLGFAPFDKQYEKLGTIVADLRDRKVPSAVIEVDYKGKAIYSETKAPETETKF